MLILDGEGHEQMDSRNFDSNHIRRYQYLHLRDTDTSQRKKGPGFRLRPKDVKLDPGQQLHLVTKLNGHPPPKLTWVKNNVALEASDRISIKSNGEDLTYSLTINNVTKEDAGRYQLKASNPLGRQQHNLIVEVGGFTGDLSQPSSALEETVFKVKVDPTIPAGAVPRLPSVGFLPKPSTQAGRRSEVSRVKQDVTPSNTTTTEIKESPKPVHSSTPLKTEERFKAPEHASVPEPEPVEYNETPKYESSENSSKESSPASLRQRSLEPEPEKEQELDSEPEPESEEKESPSVSEESAVSDNDDEEAEKQEQIPVSKSAIRVLQPLEDIETDIDEYIMLQCEFDSEAEVAWTLDEGPLPSSTVIRQVGPLAKIRIRQVTSNDFGEYVASVQDSRGSAFTKCTLRRKGSRKPSTKEQRVAVEESANETYENGVEEDSEVRNPPVISELEDMTIKEGDDLQLEINVNSPTGYDVNWLYNDQVFQADDENMTIIDKYDDLTRLILKDVNEEDSGDYVVKVTNEFGTSESQCRVDVIMSAEPPKLLSVPDEVDCQIGSLVQIEFSAENATHATLIVTDEQRITASIDGHSGFVEYEASEDSPNYAVLLLVGPGGEVEHKINFNLKSASKAPYFTERLHETTAEEGDSLSLEVAASGNPEPEYSWFKGEKCLNISSPRLQLDNISQDDAGRYSVQISNSAGSDKSTATVTVNKKPVKPSFTNYPDNQTRHAGASIDLACSFDGIPEPRVTWYFEDAKIESTSDNGSSVIKIKNFGTNDVGSYTIEAQNSAGKAMKSFSLELKEPSVEEEETDHEQVVPSTSLSFIEPLQDLKVDDGKTGVRWSVKTSNVDAIKWFGPLGEINFDSDDAEFRLESEGERSQRTFSLVFEEVFPDDGGNYKVEISNAQETLSCNAELKVVPVGMEPKFNVRPKINGTVNIGDRVSVKCEIEADPKPEVIWILGNKEIKRSSSEYTLKEAQKSDNVIEYTLEIASLKASEKGKAQVKAQNINAELTCPFTIIINEEASSNTDDFRGNLKTNKTAPPRSEPVEPEPGQKDFRTLLKKSTKTPPAPKPTSKAGQIDFRNQLKNSVQTKALTQDEIRAHTGEQVDFRKSLKTKVSTKTLEQEDLKKMAPEQKDFRETLKKKTDSPKIASPEPPAAKEPSPSPDTSKRPQIIEPPAKTVECIVGDPFRIEVQISGADKVTWLLGQDDVEADPEVGVYLDEDGDSYSLRVEESMMEDRGLYTIIAENDHGQVTCKSRVLVVAQ